MVPVQTFVVLPDSETPSATHRVATSITAATTCLVTYFGSLFALGAFGAILLMALTGVFDTAGADIVPVDPSGSGWLRASVELSRATSFSVVVPGILGSTVVLVPAVTGLWAARLGSRLLTMPLAALLGVLGGWAGVLAGFSASCLLTQL